MTVGRVHGPTSKAKKKQNQLYKTFPMQLNNHKPCAQERLSPSIWRAPKVFWIREWNELATTWCHFSERVPASHLTCLYRIE